MTLLTTLTLGLALGLKHALDADHLIAVSTIVTHERSVWRSVQIGLFWGAGHLLTLLLVGLVVLGLQRQIPTPVSLSLECLVGVVLIGLGLTTLFDCWRKRLHAHSHMHTDGGHSHFHTHADTMAHQHGHSVQSGVKPLLIGMLHGLAGSAALMLLVLTTLPSPALGIAYIIIFGCGSLLGMGLVSLLLGLFFSLANDQFSPFSQRMRFAVGTLSAGFGLWIVIETGVIQRLFLT